MKYKLYNDFLLIKQMSVSFLRKKRILTELLKEYEDFWQVVGVTESALRQLHQNQYKSGKGVNRSHIVGRDVYNTEMLTRNWSNVDEWWDYFIVNDKTILATSTENMSKSDWSKIYPIDPINGLFKNQGYSFSMKQPER